MKNLLLLGFLGLFIMHPRTVSAQEPIPVKQHLPDKPQLFTQFPDRSDCNKLQLEKILVSSILEEINLTVGNNIQLKGILAEKIRRSEQVYSVNIKLSNFDGALFNLSFEMREFDIIAIRGRIVHPQYGDVMILKEENQQYYFLKRNQKYFMTE